MPMYANLTEQNLRDQLRRLNRELGELTAKPRPEPLHEPSVPTAADPTLQMVVRIVLPKLPDAVGIDVQLMGSQSEILDVSLEY